MSFKHNDEIKEDLFEEYYAELEETLINGKPLGPMAKFSMAVEMAEAEFLRRQ